MPKVFDEAGFSGRFYMADLHEPIHVHITKDGKEAKFWVSPIACANSGVCHTAICVEQKLWYKST